MSEQAEPASTSAAATSQEVPAPATSAIVAGAHPFAKVLAALSQPVEPTLVKQRVGWKRNGVDQMVDYVEWHTVADILDRECPTWQSHIVRVEFLGQYLVVTLALTIDGVTREGMGVGQSGSEMSLKKAEHDALKRAAVKFGVARELYKKTPEDDDHQQQGGGVQGNWQAPQQGGYPQQQYSGPPQGGGYQGGGQQQQRQWPPFTQDDRYRISPAQQNAIGQMAARLNIDADQFIQRMFNNPQANMFMLSKSGASQVYEALKIQLDQVDGQQQGGYGGPPPNQFAPPMNQQQGGFAPPANPQSPPVNPTPPANPQPGGYRPDDDIPF